MFFCQEMTNTVPSVTETAANTSKGFRHLVAGVIAVVLLSIGVAHAQVETGQVGGTVIDQSGAVVSDAEVSARNLGTNAVRSTKTSSTGFYQLSGLGPATYQISVTAPSFKLFMAKVEVTVGAHVTLDAHLSINASVTEVQVVAEGGAQVNTQTQELSQVVDSEQLVQLPSLTRNPYDFVAISGNISNGDAGSSGSSSMGTNSQNSTTRGVGFNINGQRSSGHGDPAGRRRKHYSIHRRYRYLCSPGLDPGVSRIDEQLRGPVRARLGRRRERDHEDGHQHLSRRRMGIQSPVGLYLEHGNQRPGGGPERHLHAQPVWFHGRRPDQEGQIVRLRRHRSGSGCAARRS